LVRQALSLYADVPPDAWRFKQGGDGKPEIAGPASVGKLRFNLSHTTGMVVCGVTLDRDIGVDVEDSQRRVRTCELANRFFSAREVESLHALPESQRRGAFFRYWTLKESYLKARGIGLSIPLNQFSFQLEESSPIGIRFDPPLCAEDRPHDWSFWQRGLSDRHVAAVAVRTSDATERDSALEVHCRQFSLRSESPNFTAR
jgi:4'-phosphopantetheinyl transferase